MLSIWQIHAETKQENKAIVERVLTTSSGTKIRLSVVLPGYPSLKNARLLPAWVIAIGSAVRMEWIYMHLSKWFSVPHFLISSFQHFNRYFLLISWLNGWIDNFYIMHRWNGRSIDGVEEEWWKRLYRPHWLSTISTFSPKSKYFIILLIILLTIICIPFSLPSFPSLSLLR